jgi:hypothetical protein
VVDVRDRLVGTGRPTIGAYSYTNCRVCALRKCPGCSGHSVSQPCRVLWASTCMRFLNPKDKEGIAQSSGLFFSFRARGQPWRRNLAEGRVLTSLGGALTVSQPEILSPAWFARSIWLLCITAIFVLLHGGLLTREPQPGGCFPLRSQNRGILARHAVLAKVASVRVLCFGNSGCV